MFLTNAYPSFTKLVNKFKEENEIIDMDEITFFRIIITNILGL